MNHDLITRKMITMVNRNAEIKELERRLSAIPAKRRRRKRVQNMPLLRCKP